MRLDETNQQNNEEAVEMCWDEDVLNLGRQKCGLLEKRDLHGDLRFHIRSNQALRPAIMPRIRGFNDGKNPITISQSCTLCLENKTNGRLGRNVA
jgi:hypothetical protein